MRVTRRSVILAAIAAPVLLLAGWIGVAGRPGAPQALVLRLPADDPEAVPQPPPDGTRGPSALAFSRDGARLYVAEQDENDVAVLDTASRAVVAHIPSGGEQPTALALAADGNTLVVANTFSGVVAVLDIDKRSVRARIPLLGEPNAVALDGAGPAFVSLGQVDQVAVIDIAAARVTARIGVGRSPRTLLFLPDGTLLCANRIGGSISRIDAADCRETARIAMPATNLRGMALSADGRRLIVTGQQPHNDVPTDRPEGVWSNVLLSVRMSGLSASVERVIPLDAPGRGAADPCGVTLDAAGKTAFATLSGAHELIAVPLDAAPAPAVPLSRTHVGANPRAIALRPGAAEIWVGNHLGSSLTVVGRAPDGSKSDAPALMRLVDLGAPTPSPNRRLQGRFFFTSAHVVRGRRFSCDSCHPEGGTDGLSWKLAHVKEPPKVRNSRDLRGALLLTAPYGWTSREEDFEAFVEDEVTGLLKTRLLRHPEVHALWDLVNESPLPPNPYRGPDGSLTAQAQRGERLFSGEAGCTACHAGEMRGGTKRRAWIGTTTPGVLLDVPHLVGAYESAPYLHDGRAATLEEVFTKYNPQHRHGHADALTPAELADVLEFVREQ